MIVLDLQTYIDEWMREGVPYAASFNERVKGAFQMLVSTGTDSETFLTLTSDANIAAGSFVNVYDNAGTMRVRLADASDPIKPANAFATSALTTGIAPGSLAFSGLNRNAVVATAGPVWLSDVTPGGFISAAPSTTGHIVQPLGLAIPGVGIMFTPQPSVTL